MAAWKVGEWISLAPKIVARANVTKKWWIIKPGLSTIRSVEVPVTVRVAGLVVDTESSCSPS